MPVSSVPPSVSSTSISHQTLIKNRLFAKAKVDSKIHSISRSILEKSATFGLVAAYAFLHHFGVKCVATSTTQNSNSVSVFQEPLHSWDANDDIIFREANKLRGNEELEKAADITIRIKDVMLRTESFAYILEVYKFKEEHSWPWPFSESYKTQIDHIHKKMNFQEIHDTFAAKVKEFRKAINQYKRADKEKPSSKLSFQQLSSFNENIRNIANLLKGKVNFSKLIFELEEIYNDWSQFLKDPKLEQARLGLEFHYHSENSKKRQQTNDVSDSGRKVLTINYPNPSENTIVINPYSNNITETNKFINYK